MSENPQICAGDVYLVVPAFGDKFNPEAPYDELLRGGMADDTFPELFETILRNGKWLMTIREGLTDIIRSLIAWYKI